MQLLTSASHTKAHRTNAQILQLSSHEQAVAHANAIADEYAKKAVLLCHTQPSQLQVNDLNENIELTQTVVQVLAKTLTLYPKREKQHKVEKDQIVPVHLAGRPAKITLCFEHFWRPQDTAWHCLRCLETRPSTRTLEMLPVAGCQHTRLPKGLEILLHNPKGHKLQAVLVPDLKKAPFKGTVPQKNCKVFYCKKCGAWSTGQLMGLAKKCKGIPTVSGKAVLSRVSANRHPADASKHAVTPCTRLQAQMQLRKRFGNVWKQATKLPRRRTAADFGLDLISNPTTSAPAHSHRLDQELVEDDYAAEEEAAEFLDHLYDT